MGAPLRIASLGVGRIVERGLIPGIDGSNAATLVALASERPQAAVALAKRTGADAVDGYASLLARDDIDAAYVPCRGHLHHRWVIAAAEAGKHVLCEKPLAVSVSEANEMVSACESAGVVLMEAYMWRHHPRSLAVRDLVRSGEIGTLRQVNVSFSFDIDRGDWRLDPDQGGGAIYDIGGYGINASRFLTGEEPVWVDADARWHDRGVDMTSRVGLTFPSGVLANIDCSFELPFRSEIVIVGTEGEIRVPNAFLPPNRATIQRYRHSDETARVPQPPAETTFDPANQYACEIDAFCASVRDGRLIDPAEAGLANMRVIEAALTAARERREGHRREVR